jgi:hypothetical protein
LWYIESLQQGTKNKGTAVDKIVIFEAKVSGLQTGTLIKVGTFS